MKGKLALGVVTMIAVQCMFGVASELSSSTAAIYAIPVLGCLAAPACGGFVAKKHFALPAALILLLDWLLAAYAFSHMVKPAMNYPLFLAHLWPYIAASVVVGMAGAKLGERLAASRATANASPTT